MYPQMQDDMKKAREHFRVEAEDEFLTAGPGSTWLTRQVEASAKTGSRYVVVATRLPMRQREGGPILLTVLWPWQDAWTMAEEGYLDESYVAEHLSAGRGREGRLHGGDLAALTMTIRRALGREVDA